MADRNSTSNKNRLTGIVLLYFLGIFTGAVLYCIPPDGQDGRFKVIAEDFISGRFDKEFAEILVNSFCEPFVMLMICFLLGLSAVAQPAEYLVPVFHALGTGVTIAGIYDIYGVKGIAMSAVMIIPGTVISAFAVIIAVREALNMSSDIYLSAIGKNPVTAKIDIRLYFTKYVILCAIAVVSAFVQSILIFFFADIWQG
ncbi:MAG: hypothetical protein IJ035_03565 [Oscillospiraceae bacterium]|nr:hypothetical protein [Oscillospiraceae bacterium]